MRGHKLIGLKSAPLVIYDNSAHLSSILMLDTIMYGNRLSICNIPLLQCWNRAFFGWSVLIDEASITSLYLQAFFLVDVFGLPPKTGRPLANIALRSFDGTNVNHPRHPYLDDPAKQPSSSEHSH